MSFDPVGILVWVLFAALVASGVLRRNQLRELKRLSAELQEEKKRLDGLPDQHPGLSSQWWREERGRRSVDRDD